jgi:hypothetical protein
MSRYRGHDWIKVKKYEDDATQPPLERLKALQEHHRKETAFLIAEVRRLDMLLEVRSRRAGRERDRGEINRVLGIMAVAAPAVLRWLTSEDLSPEAVERGRQMQRLLDAVRADALSRALEVLTPFALMASAYDKPAKHQDEARTYDLLTPVVTVGVQALTVGALRTAREFIEQYIPPETAHAWHGGPVYCGECGGPSERQDDEYGGLAGGGDYEVFRCKRCRSTMHVEMPD